MEFNRYFDMIDESAGWIKGQIASSPVLTLVLSGGLIELINDIEDRREFDTSQIPNFPRQRAEGHAGRITFGRLCGVPLIAMQGRYHYYEGHPVQMVAFPHFVFSKLGARTLITTNAAGGINREFRPGDLMIVTDHINMMGVNPLIDIAFNRESDQFTDMTEPYDPNLHKIAAKAAKKLGIKIKKGVFVAVSGPSYETKSEIRAFRKLGADAVGMSTVPEIIAARFLGMRVLALTCIANRASDLHKGELTHEEVLCAMQAMAPKACALIKEVVGDLKEVSKG